VEKSVWVSLKVQNVLDYKYSFGRKGISNIHNVIKNLHNLRHWHFASPAYTRTYIKMERQRSTIKTVSSACRHIPCSANPDFVCDIPTLCWTPPKLLSQELPRCFLDYIAVFKILFAPLPSLNVKRQYLAGWEAENNGCFAEQCDLCCETKRIKWFLCHRMRRDGLVVHWFLYTDYRL
jgi:hypothetical protein